MSLVIKNFIINLDRIISLSILRIKIYVYKRFLCQTFHHSIEVDCFITPFLYLGLFPFPLPLFFSRPLIIPLIMVCHLS